MEQYVATIDDLSIRPELVSMINAIRKGDIGKLQSLPLDIRDYNFILEVDQGERVSPLLIAVNHKQARVVEYLLSKGANPNFEVINHSPHFGMPVPLLFLSGHCGTTVLRLLLDADAMIDPPGGRHISVLEAVISRERCRDAVRVLVEYGADLCSLSRDGGSPLLIALSNRRSEVIHDLIYGWDVNQYALFEDDILYSSNKTINNAIFSTIVNCEYSIAQDIIYTAGNQRFMEYCEASNVFELFMRVIDNDDIRRLRQFIVHAMLDVDCTNPKTGQSVLMYAVAEGKMEIVTILIEEGDAYLDDLVYHYAQIEDMTSLLQSYGGIKRRKC